MLFETKCTCGAEIMASEKYIHERCSDVPKAFKDGLKEGIRRYAWWKDGVQYVGTTGKTLESALKEIDNE